MAGFHEMTRSMSLLKVDSGVKVVGRPASGTPRCPCETFETSRLVDAVIERMFQMFSVICRSRRPK